MLQAPTADLFRDPRDLERQVAGNDVTRPVPGTDPGAAAGHHDPRPRSDGSLESALQLRFVIADHLTNDIKSQLGEELLGDWAATIAVAPGRDLVGDRDHGRSETTVHEASPCGDVLACSTTGTLL